MGARKRLRANQNKEAKKEKAFAILRDCPTSPQKMRLVADLIRGVDVQKALDMLKFCPKKLLVELKSCCFQQLLTGNKRTRVNVSTRPPCSFRKFSLMVQVC